VAEQIQFVFDGKLAAQNSMDFYELARFQYSASRLLVKLDNFRRTGGFPRRITHENQHRIIIKPFREGSFGLDILAPVLMEGVRLAYEVPISTLFSYVIERVFKRADDDTVKEALRTQNRLIDAFEANIEGRDETIRETLDLLRNEIEHGRELSRENIDLLNRLNAETERRAYLQGQRDVLRQITIDQDADLVTMAAPLLKEMNVPLRDSAAHISVRTQREGRTTNLLFATKRMADEVDIAIVDRQITRMDINVVQYNKENGWGKFRNVEWDGASSFNIPADINEDLKEEMVASMNRDMVEVDCYFVRSPAGVPLRIIIVDVREVDE
jgi:hypothetical protein